MFENVLVVIGAIKAHASFFLGLVLVMSLGIYILTQSLKDIIRVVPPLALLFILSSAAYLHLMNNEASAGPVHQVQYTKKHSELTPAQAGKIASDMLSEETEY